MKRAACLLFAAALLATSMASAKMRNVTDPDAPRSLPAEGPVAVQWTDPAQFTDLKYSGNRWEAARGNWVFQLAEHVRDAAAKRLPEGDRLEVTITDIGRAGRYEPWHGVRMQDVRIMRDVYPPSMKLEFHQYDANGQLVAEGTRELRDLGYLMSAGALPGTSDTLRFEKRMVDDWARTEFRDRNLAGR